MRRGWFIIPGMQDGDRTFEDQAEGLETAFNECAGKRVLDMGCAEGLISYEFARRGATQVIGYDVVGEHIRIATERNQWPQCVFIEQNFDHRLRDLGAGRMKTPKERYEIVAALGVLHKLWLPERGLRFVAKSCLDLLLLRTSRRYESDLIISKRDGKIQVKVPPILADEGFVLEKTAQGSRAFMEDVQYWRRVK